MVHPKVAELQRRCDEQAKLIEEIKRDMRAQLQQQWKDAGGCARCGGRGWVVTWDTLDSLSGCYAEYGPCTNEKEGTCTASTVGLDPGYHSMYDRNRGVRDPLMANSLAETVIVPLVQALATLGEALNTAKEETEVRKGSNVKVVKGRKVPKGTMGVVFWIGSSEWGERVGIKDASETVHWTSIDNVIVVLPEGEK
jgi:hypothetical protein